MRRFTFETGTVPETGGEGVEFEDGRAVYREIVGGVYTTAIEGSVSDIQLQYGGQAGFTFTWVDSDEEPEEPGGEG